MWTATESAQAVADQALAHMLDRVAATTPIGYPFCHFYVDNLFPTDLYGRLLDALPGPDGYDSVDRRYQADGRSVRFSLLLTPAGTERTPDPPLWHGVAAALMSSALKRAVFRQLAEGLSERYGVSPETVAELPGFSRPTLYREAAGYEIPPHPDTRKKVVTMHLFLPADNSQLGLGTALYRRRPLAVPVGPWRWQFARVKQFPFRPNSAYAFVVHNSVTRKSWHGRERLPAGAGVRHTLLNAFYAEPDPAFAGDGESARTAAIL